MAELLVSTAIMSLVLTFAYQVLNQGLQYYRANESALDAQREGLSVLTHLHNEMENSRPGLVRVYPDGVLFCDPYDANNHVNFDPASGQIIWQRYICYYLDPNDHRLYRKEKPLSAPTVSPDTTELDNATTGVFEGEADASRMLGTTVSKFAVTSAAGLINVTMETGDPNDSNGYWVSLQTGVNPRN